MTNTITGMHVYMYAHCASMCKWYMYLSMHMLQSRSLMPYAEYCANLVTAKHTLEAKKQEPGFRDFLQVNLCTVKKINVYIVLLFSGVSRGGQGVQRNPPFCQRM